MVSSKRFITLREIGSEPVGNISESVFVNPFVEMWKFSKLGDCELISLVLDFVACSVLRAYSISAECGVSVIYRVWAFPQPPQGE